MDYLGRSYLNTQVLRSGELFHGKSERCNLRTQPAAAGFEMEGKGRKPRNAVASESWA